MRTTLDFLNKICKLAERYDMFPDGGVVLLGVSGGADSMCLLDALLEISITRGFKVIAAHFNHMLRGAESDSDEAFVKHECEKRDIELIIDSADVMSYASQNGMGKVEAARELRYAFFEKAADRLASDRLASDGLASDGLAAANGKRTVRIATAHNADDLAETVIINLARGAGMSGLSGIPPRRGSIIRPMLHISRNEIMEYISLKGIRYVEDSSNSLQNQVRNKVRHSVVPILREINPRFTESAVRTAQLISRDEEYLMRIADEYVSDYTKEHSNADFLSASGITTLPYPIKSRVIKQAASNMLSNEHINAVLELCESGRPSAGLSLPGLIVRREYDKVFFDKSTDFTGVEDEKREAEPRNFGPIYLKAGSEIDIPEAGVKVLCSITEHDNQHSETADVKTFSTFLFHIDEICGTMFVGSRREGDNIKLLGSNHTRSLKKLFIDNRVPAAKRRLVPVIFDEQGVLAVYNICRSNRAMPKPGRKAMKIEFIIHN